VVGRAWGMCTAPTASTDMTRATRGMEDTTQVSKRVGLAVEGFLSLCRHVQTAGPCVIDAQS
jgi:hypothetical protein